MDKRFNRRPKRRTDDYTPAGNPEALATPIEKMGLSERTLEALQAGGIKTAADIASRRMRDMYRVQNIGKRNCMDMERALSALGLAFRPEEPAAAAPADKNGAKDKENRDRQRRDNRERNDSRERGDNRERQDNRRQEGRGRDNRQEQTARDQGRKGGREKESARAVNEMLSRMYAGMTINEIIAGGKRKRPVFQPYPKEGLKQGDLVKFCRRGKWGYKDWKGNVVIEPTFDEAFSFSEGLAGVEKDGLIGYIDKTGKVVIDYTYDCATSFHEGLAAVSRGEKSGYIDDKGNQVVEYVYDVATPFDGGKAVVRADERWGVLDRQTMQVLWR